MTMVVYFIYHDIYYLYIMNIDILCIILKYVNSSTSNDIKNVSKKFHNIVFGEKNMIVYLHIVPEEILLSNSLGAVIKRCRHIYYPYKRLQNVINCIYNNITMLTICDTFDESIDCLCNLRLTHLYLGENFNHSVDNLPKSLKYLEFWGSNGFSRFHQPINNLPDGLTHLKLSVFWNGSIDRFPNSITHLVLGQNFNHSVDKLPNKLTHLTFNYYFNQPINNLPNSITHLSFGVSFNMPILNLPRNLVYLSFGDNFNQSLDNLHMLSSLKYLKFGHDFDQYIGKYPDSLTCLKFGSRFNKPIVNLPESLETLITMNNYSGTIHKFDKKKAKNNIVGNVL